MKFVKKMQSLILVAIMVLTIVPMTAIESKAASLTQSQFDSKLSSAKSLYPDGSQKYEWSVNGSVVGWQCHGYARWLSYYVWGVDFANGKGANWTLYKSTASSTYINSLMPGDVVRYRNSTSKTYNHTIFITKISGSTIYFTDCNSDGNNTIKWNRSVSKSTLESYLKISLYGSEAATYGYIAHYTLNTLGSTSTSYQTGNYTVTTSAGLNLRSTASTSGSVLATIPYNKTVTVTKISGNWGYTTYNGISGWICLDYTKYVGAESKQYKVDVWASTKGKGYQYNQCSEITSGTAGKSYDIWYKLYDSSSGNLYNEGANFNAKISIYYPNGDELFSTTYNKSESNWIFVTPDVIGTYKMRIQLTGDITADYSKSFTVTSDMKLVFEKTSINLTLPDNEKTSFSMRLEGTVPSGAYMTTTYDKNIIDVQLENQVFTCTGLKAGTTNYIISVYDKKGNLIVSKSCAITVSNVKYTVTYNANGGTGAPSNQTKEYGKTLTLSSTKPTKTGYTFDTWTSSSNGSGFQFSSGGSYTYNQNMTLYAQYTANTYTVKYDSNGGIGTTSSSTHTYDKEKTLTANGFTRTGYNFAGWAKDSAATATAYADKSTVKNLTTVNGGTVTLYARWKPIEYSIEYNANDGTGNVKHLQYTYDVEKALSANSFTRMGYTFIGWSQSPSATYATYKDKQIVKNLTATNGGKVILYAVWSKNSDSVIGDVDGNGELNIKDATAIQMYLAGYSEINLDVADYDGDGDVNVKDATAIQMTLAGF